MSRRNSHTTADYMPWADAICLINRLYKEGQYRMSLLIGCGIFFGLRISDLRTLRWSMLLNTEKFELQEKKTNKYRQVKINSDFEISKIFCDVRPSVRIGRRKSSKQCSI